MVHWNVGWFKGAIQIFTSGKYLCKKKSFYKQGENLYDLLEEETKLITFPMSQSLFTVCHGLHLAKLPRSSLWCCAYKQPLNGFLWSHRNTGLAVMKKEIMHGQHNGLIIRILYCAKEVISFSLLCNVNISIVRWL